MKFADLHCDTPYRMYNEPTSDLHITSEKTSVFEKYTQVNAFWSDCGKTDADCYRAFIDIYDNFISKFENRVCFSKKDVESKDIAFILSVEDLRIVEDKPERLNELFNKGIRIATLTWKDTNILGGAWNTDTGLTEYGHLITEEMLRIGIIPDLSHGSRKLIRDVYEICKKSGKSFCATHSNSFSVYSHKRNLTDEDARLIADTGGIIGISLYPTHLSKNNSDTNTVINHIDHYINLVGCDSVGFGCDFDGIDLLPSGISDVSSMLQFLDKLSSKYGEALAEKILYNNVNNYLLNNM